MITGSDGSGYRSFSSVEPDAEYSSSSRYSSPQTLLEDHGNTTRPGSPRAFAATAICLDNFTRSPSDDIRFVDRFNFSTATVDDLRSASKSITAVRARAVLRMKGLISSSLLIVAPGNLCYLNRARYTMIGTSRAP